MIRQTASATATWVGTGYSSERDGLLAGRIAAEQARQQLGSQRIDLAMLFGSVRLNQERLIKGVREVIGDAPLMGGSDAGEIYGTHPLTRSCVLMLITSDAFTFVVRAHKEIGRAPLEGGRTLAQACLAQSSKQRRAFIMLSDGITGASQELIRGVQEVVGTSFPLVGGLTGDDLLYRETYQYYNDAALTGSVVGCLVSGTGRIAIGARHGWNPVGQPHNITKSNGSILHQLDAAPAVAMYTNYLSEEEVRRMEGWLMTQAAIRYPLGMSLEGEEELLLRNVLQLTPDGSMICAGEIHPDSYIQFMVGTRGSAIEAAQIAATQVHDSLGRIDFALLFDSVARKRLFGRYANHELETIRAALGPRVPFIGCYTYGEQAPVRSSAQMGRSYFHNEAVLIVGFGA